MQVSLALREICEGILDLLYPPICLLCGVRLESGAMCVVCQADITPFRSPFCARCGVAVREEGTLCVECIAQEPAFAWSIAAGLYAGTLRRAIHLLKYHEKAALAEPLGSILAQSLGEPPAPLFGDHPTSPLFDLVVPVPLHTTRQRLRGFNQAERLAKVVAKERGWLLEAHALRRTRATPSQTTLSGEERRRNVHRAFVVESPAIVAGKSILLIDDVLTTTSTVGECARTLRDAGAKRVCVAALARGE